ncbi:DUF6438 domain-containing protein [Flavobacterium sp. RHBU_3]|uniref:DUF6438 domain-containing protein n=1 Tax=Flavobacterium sp. RHBU_3 TaxID=3391184 RepID=UPI003985482E
MKTLYFLPLLLLFFSCKNEKEEQLKRDIVGEWKFVSGYIETACRDSVLSPPPPGLSVLGYGFYENGVCEYKHGFQIIHTLNDRIVVGYDGKKCTYTIGADSLKIVLGSGKVWQAYKIEYLKGDMLSLRVNSCEVVKMARMHYAINPAEHYDAIEVISSLGRMKIDSKGNVLYKANSITGSEGYLQGNVTKEKYSQFERDFLKANVVSLDTFYASKASDGATAIVSFIRNGKTVKKVQDDEQSSPAEFQWAYRNLIYLFTDKNLKPYRSKYPEMTEWGVIFSEGEKEYILMWLEQYTLVTGLDKAKTVTITFNSKYKMQYGHEHKMVITDGRYYKFPPEDGSKTLDLGYNFIERNGLEKRFVKVDDLSFL